MSEIRIAKQDFLDLFRKGNSVSQACTNILNKYKLKVPGDKVADFYRELLGECDQ